MTVSMLNALILGPSAAAAVACVMVHVYRFLARSVGEVHAFRCHERWKREVLAAFRR